MIEVDNCIFNSGVIDCYYSLIIINKLEGLPSIKKYIPPIKVKAKFIFNPINFKLPKSFLKINRGEILIPNLKILVYCKGNLINEINKVSLSPIIKEDMYGKKFIERDRYYVNNTLFFTKEECIEYINSVINNSIDQVESIADSSIKYLNRKKL